MSTIEIRVPDIGDFKDIPIIEVHVAPGAKVNVDDPLITLESDKATMDVPAPQAGTVHELTVKTGDRVSEGDLILFLEAESPAAIPPKERIKEDAAPTPGGGPPNYGSTSGLYDMIEVKVPNIGDFKDVEIIEVHVEPGAVIKAEDPLITLESDKATLEVPSPAAGTAAEIKVKPGDRVSEGDLILLLRTAEAKAHDAASHHAAGADSGREAAGRGAGRPARRGAGLGRRARRLLGRVPRRRSRQEGGADRALAVAGWRLPQCRLHPVQGAAARRQGHQRGPRDGRARDRLRRALDRHRQAARLEGRRGQAADWRSRRLEQATQGHRRHGLRPLRRPEPGRGQGRRWRHARR